MSKNTFSLRELLGPDVLAHIERSNASADASPAGNLKGEPIDSEAADAPSKLHVHPIIFDPSDPEATAKRISEMDAPDDVKAVLTDLAQSLVASVDDETKAEWVAQHEAAEKLIKKLDAAAEPSDLTKLAGQILAAVKNPVLTQDASLDVIEHALRRAVRRSARKTKSLLDHYYGGALHNLTKLYREEFDAFRQEAMRTVPSLISEADVINLARAVVAARVVMKSLNEGFRVIYWNADSETFASTSLAIEEFFEMHPDRAGHIHPIAMVLSTDEPTDLERRLILATDVAPSSKPDKKSEEKRERLVKRLDEDDQAEAEAPKRGGQEAPPANISTPLGRYAGLDKAGDNTD